jgi:hypothetical protein
MVPNIEHPTSKDEIPGSHAPAGEPTPGQMKAIDAPTQSMGASCKDRIPPFENSLLARKVSFSPPNSPPLGDIHWNTGKRILLQVVNKIPNGK